MRCGILHHSSVALSWCFEDERTPATAALLDQVAESGAVAPLLGTMQVCLFDVPAGNAAAEKL